MKCFFKMSFVIFFVFAFAATDLSAREFEKRFDETMPGRMVSVSNSLITCDTADSRCAGAQGFTGPVYQNGPFVMVNIDDDSDGSTFNSSSADLQIPSGTVVHAELYWGGQYTDNGAPHKFTPPPNPGSKSKVLFKVPGGAYVSVDGAVDEDGEGFYQGHADVTSLIAGSGFYTVANAQFTTGKQMFGGWTLVVIVKSELEPRRRIVLWDGFLRHETDALGVALKDTLGDRRRESSIELNIVQYDGDKGNYDSMSIDGNLFIPKNLYPVTDPNAAGDIANSSITKFGKRFEDRKPFYKNTLGYDSDLFQIYRYVDSDESIELEFKTRGDIIHLGVVSVQSDVEDRFVQTDWGNGANGTSSTLLSGERGFERKSGHIFHDTVVGALHAVQFSYTYEGQQYEVSPVRSNRTDDSYYTRWRSTASIYPFGACQATKYWIYREVDRSRVSWLFGAGRRGEARPACDSDVETQFAITGGATLIRSDDTGETTLTDSDHRWNGDNRDGAVIRFVGREFKVVGQPITTTSASLIHDFYLDTSNNSVPYSLNSTNQWEFESDFDGRLESKIFDGLIPRGFGNLNIGVSQTNSSVVEVFFRTGDSIANVQSKVWEGPFVNGDPLGNATTNNHQFFQYAVVTKLTDPANNTVESELTFSEVSFDLYGIAIPLIDGTWKRVADATALKNIDTNINIADAKIPTLKRGDDLVHGQLEVLMPEFERVEEEDALSDPNAACSTSQRTLTWFPLLMIAMFWGRRKRSSPK